MKSPERIPLHTLCNNPFRRKKITQIAGLVREGAIFVYPTETIYGLGGVYNVKVKNRILSAKQKPLEQPMILIAANRRCFSSLPIIFPPAAERLAHIFWPGMLTMVLPSMRTEQGEGIAVRISHHPFIKALYRYIDQPIFSTSANLSGEAYVNDPGKIYSVFIDSIDFLIDAGKLPASPPSTIVRIGTDNNLEVLREGSVLSDSIFKALQ